MRKKHIAEAETAFIELEKKPDSTELINDIFRHFHSVKGDAASIGVDAVRDLAHELESILDKLREREFAVTPGLLDLLLEGLTTLSNQIGQIADGAEVSVARDLVMRLAKYQPPKEQVFMEAAAVEEVEQLPIRIAAQLETDQSPETNDDKTYILFRTGKIACGINVDQSNEIIGKPHITPVPNVEIFIEGVINLRGSIVPVINLERRLNIPAAESENLQILIVIIDGHKLGFLVNEVFGVKTWSDRRIMRPESVAFNLDRTFVNGVITESARIILLLNIPEILKRKNNI